MRSEILVFFAKFIERELGIVYAEHNYYQLEVRLEEITRFFGLADIEELYKKSQEGITGNFKQLILDVATNNETSFFRDPRVFQSLENKILPELFSNPKFKEGIRIWSAASSGGQEPYSLAIQLIEFSRRQVIPPTEITATDISQRMLDKAASGKYSQLEVQRGLSTPLLLKYFTKDEQDYWTVKPELRSLVSFRKQNLRDPLSFDSGFHLILCRNVLIYQNVENKAAILKKIEKVLLPDGYLLMGAGESTLGITDAFEQVMLEGAVLYRLKVKS